MMSASWHIFSSAMATSTGSGIDGPQVTIPWLRSSTAWCLPMVSTMEAAISGVPTRPALSSQRGGRTGWVVARGTTVSSGWSEAE